MTVCFFLITQLYSQEQTIAEDDKRYFLPAIAETLGSNVLLFSFNRFVMRYDFSFITPDTIADHFREPWAWDGDNILINQLGHPYQGLVYHTAARANGFGFYEALAFNAFGSITWEMFTETDIPAPNDLITTTIGGAVFGEMTHRLFLEVDSPWAFLISPVDALNGVITKRKPARGRTNIYGITLRTGAEYDFSTITDHRIGKNISVFENRHSGAAAFETHIIYGNPFEQQSKIPYNHFELTLGSSIGVPLYYNIKMLSDGYLFSFSPIDTGGKKLSTGLSLHNDLFAGSLINHFNEALDWTVKYQRYFDTDMRTELKAHAGWSFLSGSNFYTIEENRVSQNPYRDYGMGWNFKVFFSLCFPNGGIFSADMLLYRMFTLSHEVLEASGLDAREPDAAQGLDTCNIFELSYRHPLTESFFIGISDSLSGKFGSDDTFTSVELWINTARLFVEWRF
jgi:hypothetical protein